MKLALFRRYAMALPEVIEEPYHEGTSFRVRGKIFVTVPPTGGCVHVFLNEKSREQALAMYPCFVERLLWGGKVWGIRIALDAATPSVVKGLIHCAWSNKAPKQLAAAYQADRASPNYSYEPPRTRSV